jgi:hypothetical protein
MAVQNDARIEDAINRAGRLGQVFEDLVYSKAKTGRLVVRAKNDDLLLAYWSLIFDYFKGIGCLLHHKYYSSAFALLRPTVEALVRFHIVLIGSEQEVVKIRKDRYKVSYEKDGARIDTALGSTPYFDEFLKKSQHLLHSLTHSGKAQLSKRFDGNAVGENFSDAELSALLDLCSYAAFEVTQLMSVHFELPEEGRAAQQAWIDFAGEGRK